MKKRILSILLMTTMVLTSNVATAPALAQTDKVSKYETVLDEEKTIQLSEVTEQNAYQAAVKAPLRARITKIKLNGKKAVLTWKEQSKASGYEIYMSKSKSGTYKKTRTINKPTITTYTTANLTEGTTYYYKVRAYKKVGNKKVYGDYSAVKSIKPATNKELLKKYFNNTLVSKYGKFDNFQQGIKYNQNDTWLNPSGIMGVTIMDFDGDKKDEMLVTVPDKIFYYQSYYGYRTDYRIMLHMYEVKDGEVELAATQKFLSYYPGRSSQLEGQGDPLLLCPDAANGSVYKINIINSGKQKNIVCEQNYWHSAYADGGEQNYWVLNYKNNRFNYRCSFSQMGMGSADLDYTFYKFTNGNLDKSELVYSEYYETPGRYSTFKEAMTASFGAYGIQLTNLGDYSVSNIEKTILSSKHPIVSHMKYIQKSTASSDYTYHRFTATLKSNVDKIR